MINECFKITAQLTILRMFVYDISLKFFLLLFNPLTAADLLSPACIIL